MAAMTKQKNLRFFKKLAIYFIKTLSSTKHNIAMFKLLRNFPEEMFDIFKWWSTKKEFQIGSQKIIIKYRCSLAEDQKKILEAAIVKSIQDSKLAKRFLLLTVIIYFIKSKGFWTAETKGRVKPDYIKPFEIKIDLFLNQGDFEQRYFQLGIISTLNHELTHGWQEIKTRSTSLQAKAENRLLELSKDVSYFHQSVDTIMQNPRRMLHHFFSIISLEGTAGFIENYYSGSLELDEDYFQNRYLSSKEAMEKFSRKWQEFLVAFHNNQNKKKIDWPSNYALGEHLAFTIAYVGRENFEDLVSLKPFQMIKRYEACMKIKGLQPVVSLTSGKGIFDYRHSLAEWQAATKK